MPSNAMIENLKASHKMFTDFVSEWNKIEAQCITPEARGEAKGAAKAYALAAQTIAAHIANAKILAGV